MRKQYHFYDIPDKDAQHKHHQEETSDKLKLRNVL